jgi:hypothetical protein
MVIPCIPERISNVHLVFRDNVASHGYARSLPHIESAR